MINREKWILTLILSKRLQQLFAGLNRAVIFNGLEREGGFDKKSEAFIFG